MDLGSSERRLIDAILDSPADDPPRIAYSEWLLAEGEGARSRLVRATCVGTGALDLTTLESELAVLPAEHLGWSRLVGARLIRETCALGLERFLTRWLRLARPALELVVGPPSVDAPIGATRLWGDPDLPAGMRWPTLADCQRWEPELDLPLESPCQFVAQFDLAALAKYPAARALPKRGLLSIFSHHEWQKTGSSSICLRYFENADGLVRVPHAATDQDNRRLDPHQAEVCQVLTIPGCSSSPFAEAMGVPHKDWDTIEKHEAILEASGGGLLGIAGHDRATTGADPTPGMDWERLITIPMTPDAGTVQHLAISQASLRAGRLEDHELVWVDFG